MRSHHHPSRLGPKAMRFIRMPLGWGRYTGWNEADQEHWKRVLAVADIPMRGPDERYNGRRGGGIYSTDQSTDGGAPDESP